MKRGTIVLAPFPFTDLSGRRLRPALVVSRSDRSGNDVILAFVTTQLARFRPQTDVGLDDAHPDFSKTGLKQSSIIKLDKLVTVESSILLGELGELSDVLLQQVNEKLRYALEVE